MASKIKMEIINTEKVKPSSPTPNDLKSFKLSVLDQLASTLHTRVLLFFPKTDTSLTCQNHKRSELLKKSLSETLNIFYPFAGRLIRNLSIDCNDNGAEFTETNVNRALSAITEKPDPEILIQLVPGDIVSVSEENPLLLVKASFFECGGMTVGVSISHKLGDAATINLFLRFWASKSLESLGSKTEKSLLLPQIAPSFLSFPSQDSLALLTQTSAGQSRSEKIAVRRIVFSGPKITALRKRLSSSANNLVPTRVEAVLALIWKCAMEASRVVSGGLSIGHDQRQSVLFQAVNLRGRAVSVPQPNTSGNFSWSFAVKCRDETRNETEPKNLVALLRKGIDEFKQSCESRITWEGLSGLVTEYAKLAKNGGVDIFVATSWCRFPFYEADFGWGNPSWVCVPSIRFKNYIVLMDGRSDSDGIQVWLSLGEEQMNHFEGNKELLQFVSINPSATDLYI